MMKYTTPEMMVVLFETEDVITTSEAVIIAPPTLEDDTF